MATAFSKPAGVGINTNNPEFEEMTADPQTLRKMSEDGKHPGIAQRAWGMEARMDPNVTFEEYIFWAKIEREMEKEEKRQYNASIKSQGVMGMIKSYFVNDMKNKDALGGTAAHTGGSIAMTEKGHEAHEGQDSGSDANTEFHAIAPSETHAYDAEWRKASRALRTSGWMTVFYLITTDILGWGQTPYVFANNGYNYAIGIFVLFGVAAITSGMMIWWTFLGLDSSRYPLMSFGDPFLRLFGPRVRHVINAFQAFQMFCTVCVIVLGGAGIIYQLDNGKMCFIGDGVILVAVGIASCVIRSLKHIGFLANFAVWLNIASFIIILYAAPKYGPDNSFVRKVTLLGKEPPRPAKAFWTVPPPDYQQQTKNLFAAQFNGIDSIVYAYSGALLFYNFLAEMRHPMDFWKGALLAQCFIMVVYIFFGAFVYAYYGQYSYSVITQAVLPVRLQVVSNVLGLITSFLAVFMYFNIGMKVVYLHVCQEIFGLPAITTKKGKWFWIGLGPIYWIVAWVFSMSVPNFNGITGLIGALLSLNFTYTIPVIIYVGYVVQRGAILPGEGFDPVTRVTTRHDTGMKRWIRGVKNTWYYSIPAALFAMGGMAASGMGAWGAILGLEANFSAGSATSWSCTYG